MWEQFKALVKGIFTTNLRIELKSIQWAHRFGHFIERNKRQISANFSSDKEKEAILKNASKFKSLQYSVEQDF